MRVPRIVPVLCGAALVLVAIAWCRGGEYDEFYSVFLITGHPRPDWPEHAFIAVSARHFYRGQAGYGEIAQALRRFDVHPPLYFWLLSVWHRLVGDNLFALRLFSVIETVAALALLARLATRIGVSASLAVTITTLCYGFAYTGIVARDFALATLCVLAGTLLLVEAERNGRTLSAGLGGALLGAASFSNYLACFPTLTLLAWFTAVVWRKPRLWLAAATGSASFIPAGLWFFIAQTGTRRGQFPPFHFIPAIVALGRNEAGALIGALPRYAPNIWSRILMIALALILSGLLYLVGRNGLPKLERRYAALILAGFVAPPLGLLILGMLFDSQPIEMRYVWLGLPFAGLALAATLRERRWILWTLLTIQTCAIAGLALAPATMQPANRTASAATRIAGPDTLVILPFGNDGVGIPGPFIAAAPPAMRLLVARRVNPALLAAMNLYHRVAIARIMVDGESRAIVPRLENLFRTSRCWQSVPAPRELAVFANECHAGRDDERIFQELH